MSDGSNTALLMNETIEVMAPLLWSPLARRLPSQPSRVWSKLTIFNLEFGTIDRRNLALVVNRHRIRVQAVRHSQAADQFRGRRQRRRWRRRLRCASQQKLLVEVR